ncbi:MAG: DNA cytosine methyltransferase [Acidobacteriota bacterium]|nr:DNA cytosine methyltransferase [Acidobacteriota bacterium]
MNKYLQILDDAWKLHLEERQSNAPTVISTFAGCGGSTLGYSMAGFKELLAVEWDDNAVETFKLNFPDIPVYHGDIANLSIEECMNLANIKVGKLDVFDGSPPCQGFSTAGKRIMQDSRNFLFKEYSRLLKGLQPKVFIMENVSGMVKGKMKLIFAEILRELKSCGYKVKAVLMNAMYFNVPQSRQRMIFIGIREDLQIEPSLPKGKSNLIPFSDAVNDLPVNEQIESLNHVWVDEIKRQTKWIEAVKTLKQGRKLVPNLPSSIRAYLNKPLPTIQKNAMPNQPPYVRNSTIHPTADRTLSIREMARCQTFSDNYIFVDALRNGMQRIGNSVPPLFMKAIAEHIRAEILDKREIKRISQSEAANG